MVTHVYYSEDTLDVRPHIVFFFRAVLGSGSSTGEIGSTRGAPLSDSTLVSTTSRAFSCSRGSFCCSLGTTPSSPWPSSGMGRSSSVIALSCGAMSSVESVEISIILLDNKRIGVEKEMIK